MVPSDPDKDSAKGQRERLRHNVDGPYDVLRMVQIGRVAWRRRRSCCRHLPSTERCRRHAAFSKRKPGSC